MFIDSKMLVIFPQVIPKCQSIFVLQVHYEKTICIVCHLFNVVNIFKKFLMCYIVIIIGSRNTVLKLLYAVEIHF